ncbi:ribonuclease H-like domain-containing protein [Rhizophagus irregularis DAOM 181602=DAOM 197198]|nr:ribonuclease H-like domain-containing protein [Rhizophagus irregularis DAOM 181602=DAOM 197198]
MVQSLKKYIISTNLKSGATNKICYCRACFSKLGENHPELKKIVDKTDRILNHFKNCQNFQSLYNQQEKDEVFSVNKQKSTVLGKRILDDFDPTLDSIVERRESFSSHSSLTSLPSQWSNYGPMESFITRSLSSADKIKFHMHLLQVTISCGFSLSWINNPEVIELFKFLNPQIKLPDRKTLSNEILDEAVKEFDIKMLEKLVLDRVGITLSFDGWTNVREQELMGTVLTSSDGQPYVWKASDISSERVTNIEVRLKVEEMMSQLDELKIPLLAVVTDSAPAYNAASIIATKNALRSLATKFEPSTSTNKRRPTDPLTIPCEIYNIIMNGHFWESLIKLEQLLLPYCAILNILQTDKARLFEVLHGFAYIYQFWQKYPDNNMANGILIRLQKRWELWEQPLLILSWLLHPAYRSNYFTLPSRSQISYLHIGKWLVYYYKAWTGKDPISILKEFEDFSQGTKYPFDDASISQFKNDIHRYWCWVRSAYPEIGTVAARIFGICVNAASVERLWSSMGFLHTKARNRLKFSRVLNMAKLRADITYKRRKQESVLLKSTTANINLEQHINLDNLDEQNKENDSNINNRDKLNHTESEESDDDDNDDTNIEEQFQNQINQIGGDDDDELDIDDINVENIEHPAQNKDAKWRLDTMFKDNLHCPF